MPKQALNETKWEQIKEHMGSWHSVGHLQAMNSDQ
jgi:hypothetical protein